MGWKDEFPDGNRYFETSKGLLYNQNALSVLKEMPDNVVDTVITDPPYGLSNHSEKLIRKTMSEWLNGNESFVPDSKGFMGKSWDAFVPPPALWKEVFRVMKPGATALVFAGSRTQDLMSVSLRLAGFEIKDTLMWLYGSGFPKATDISKQIDKKDMKEEAKQWDGYKSHGLKPAYEPIIMAIKPNEGSYAQNALKWGVAGLNIDEGKIGVGATTKGRFPANILFDEEAAKMLDCGFKSAKGWGKPTQGKASGEKSMFGLGGVNPQRYDFKTNPSRFFYVAKASKKERNMGFKEQVNNHPTVKPIRLMEYLVKLTKMPSSEQIYLDPFTGSGTTLLAVEKQGKNWIGIELNDEYCKFAKARLTYTVVSNVVKEIKLNNFF